MNTKTVIIRNTRTKDLEKILKFTDKWVGKRYFNKEQLRKILLQGIKNDLNASRVAEVENQIVGLRLTLAPGEWCAEYTSYISTNLWNCPTEDVACFRSLFIDEKFQGRGLGKILTQKSLDVLEKMGAKAVVCHSWIESPNDSSMGFLKSFGFESINIHKNLWYYTDYECIRCGPKNNCNCSAAEMIKYI